MDLKKQIGLFSVDEKHDDRKLIEYLNLKLAFLGCPTAGKDDANDEMISALLLHQQETSRLLAGYLCPADNRIQEFLTDYLSDVCAPADVAKLPSRAFVLDQHGLARALSLPHDRDEFHSDIVSSYRVKQGVLHNPKSDRRTTQGIFHIVEGGMPIPDDKIGVPKIVFANLLKKALDPPTSLMNLPFTSSQENQAACWVSLLLRPLVSPEVAGYAPEKRTEIRFFAPGNLVGNLDFVETIFGNAGDPFLPQNDAALDVEHWTGHTGCVILATHLIYLTKKEVGLPHFDNATELQRRDGACWRDESELYNDGKAFKIACRDERGVMVTIIADNYFGYCKKEVKTQISYSANLCGTCEEEHSGGALVFPSYDLGEDFNGQLHAPQMGHSFNRVLDMYGEMMDVQPEGYAIDKQFPDIIYVAEDAVFDLHTQSVSWPFDKSSGNAGDDSTAPNADAPNADESADQNGEQRAQIKMLPGKTYVRPSGHKIHMEKPPGGRAWRLTGTMAEGTFCHKPSTVSGGGKSEISKSINDAILQGPVFVADFDKDFDKIEELINRDYSGRFTEKSREKLKSNDNPSRPILSNQRSLGSVIKLLTPASRDFNTEYNEWLENVPQHIKELVFVVKRFYKPQWGSNWREHFSVDIINGTPGNELKCDGQKLVSNFLRVGYDNDGAWRTFGLRKDFHPAAKWALEDDISVSTIVPADVLKLNPEYSQAWVKFVGNCEYRLFQRPDDAIIRGYDKQTEADFARHDNFFSNYEPMPAACAPALVEDSIGFDKWTIPIQKLVQDVAQNPHPDFFVSPAHPRLVDGKPTKNPRYLQTRPDLLQPREAYLAQTSTRMFRRIPLGEPVRLPVNAVLPGRRNNPPEAAAGIRSLAVYNPIHYMELPELFMEFICSMTGKSPSTTGAGSEGALTKGPFNALHPIIDLNNALVSYVLTGNHAFITAAGYIGPNARVDHDISLLVPEVWCRMSPAERDPQFLIRNNYLEKCEDLEHEGRTILTSRLGYRITRRFVKTYFGRVFNHPQVVFTEEMLRPEKQSLEMLVDGMDNIIETQQRVAQLYFNDGGVEMACPALKALLHIMRDNNFEGRDVSHLTVRALFTAESLLASDWYAERETARQTRETELWNRHVKSLESFLVRPNYAGEAARLGIEERLTKARQTLEHLQNPA